MVEKIHKYEVKVNKLEKSQKITPEVKEKLREVGMVDEKGKLKVNGVSPKMLKRMKLEYVKCPVLKEDVQFIQCFVCPNFHSRVTGNVLCIGKPLGK